MVQENSGTDSTMKIILLWGVTCLQTVMVFFFYIQLYASFFNINVNRFQEICLHFLPFKEFMCIYFLHFLSERFLKIEGRQQQAFYFSISLRIYITRVKSVFCQKKEEGSEAGFFLFFYLFFVNRPKSCLETVPKQQHKKKASGSHQGSTEWAVIKAGWNFCCFFFFFFLSQFLSQSDTTLNQSNKTSDSYEYSRKKILATSYPS